MTLFACECVYGLLPPRKASNASCLIRTFLRLQHKAGAQGCSNEPLLSRPPLSCFSLVCLAAMRAQEPFAPPTPTPPGLNVNNATGHKAAVTSSGTSTQFSPTTLRSASSRPASPPPNDQPAKSRQTQNMCVGPRHDERHGDCNHIPTAPPPPWRCLSGGGPGDGWRGSTPPPAGMNHIGQELQKCTTLTHSAYTFVIMSEHSSSNHLFGSIHCALT